MKMMTKAGIARLGLVGLMTVACTSNPSAPQTQPKMTESYSTDVYTVHQHNLSRPVGCEKIIDIRYEQGHAYSTYYQLLCEDNKGEMALFVKHHDFKDWNQIRVVPTMNEQIEQYKVKQ